MVNPIQIQIGIEEWAVDGIYNSINPSEIPGLLLSEVEEALPALTAFKAKRPQAWNDFCCRVHRHSKSGSSYFTQPTPKIHLGARHWEVFNSSVYIEEEPDTE